MKSEIADSEIPQYHKLEIERIYQWITDFIGLRLRAYILLITGNITLMVLAFNLKRAELIVFAVSVCVLLIIGDAFGRRNLYAIYCRGIMLEERCAPDPENATLHTLILAASSEKDRLSDFQGVNAVADLGERQVLLRRFRFSISGVAVPLAIILIELGVSAFYF